MLVVEDDVTLGSGVVAALAADAYEVRWARDLMQARTLLQSGHTDLLLLDLGLPDGEGVELCRWLREHDDHTLVMVLTARTDEADVVQALDAGADDYLAKPFRSAELLARVRAHLRRRDVSGQDELRSGRTRLDLRGRRAWVDDIELPLRPKEFELLTVLLGAAGSAVRREQLMDEVWDANWQGSTKTLDVHVANVRRKLADAGERWDRIATLRGYGYRFDVD